MPQPLQFTEVEIPLGEGPDEKTARLLRAPGILRSAYNVDHRQNGMLRKRRGFARVELDDVVNEQEDSEEMFHALGKLRGELVIVGAAYVYGLSSVGANLTAEHTSATISRRGPTMRGGYAIEAVFSSNLGDL